MSKYTPGPLVVGKVGRQVVDIDAPSGDPTLKHASWTGLIQCYGCDDSPAMGQQVAEANAARLALCWNTHDQLVEALRALIDGTQHCGEMQWCGEDSNSPWEKARAALAAAEATP